MSAKWRALQHRHRYTYNAVIFPPSYAESLSCSLLASHPKCSTFVGDLRHLISLTSIYTQVAHAKTLASSFSNLVRDSGIDANVLELASRFYLEVLFMEDSPPLHRTLVSGLSRISDADRQFLVRKCFGELCKEYNGTLNKKKKNKRFCLSKVALSFMGMPKLGYLVEIIEDCAILVAWDVVIGLESVVLETEQQARPSPVVLEQCQDALSCLYYLLQRFPEKFKDSNNVDGEGNKLSVLERAFEVLIRVLKSVAFTRDCFVAAGVSLCAALQASLSDEELGLLIAQGILNQFASCSLIDNVADGDLRDAMQKVPYKGDFCLEVHNLPVLSRLCLIRGILTAVSRTVLTRQFLVKTDKVEGNGDSSTSVKTILYDGILLELCNYCEKPSDSHFNFHALTVMQICLQQMKTSMFSRLTELSGNYNPIPEEMGTRILRIIWNNLEDPLSQTVKQVHLTFDLFLDIQSTLHSGVDSKGIKPFLVNIASHVLRMGARCKGRYAPLASLTKRLGAQALLDMNPDLMDETAQAYIDDDVCCAATSFLKCFLEIFRDECWSNNGVETGYELYRGYILPPFLGGLASGISKLRSNLNTYALPVLLEVDVDSIFPMIAFISIGPESKENGIGIPHPEVTFRKLELRIGEKVAVLISLLKVSRSVALLEGDIDLSDINPDNNVPLDDEKGADLVGSYGIVCIKGILVKVPVEWLVMALTHVDESLRVDAAETLFLNPKTSSLPSHLELSLLKEAVPLNMRSCSTGFQMKWSSLFRKFFSRVQTALERQFKQNGWKPSSKMIEPFSNGEVHAKRAVDLFSFMRWLGCFLFFSCYPSAPYKRKIMATELIQIMLNVWSIKPSQDESESCLYPYSKSISSPDSTLLLVGSVVDSWDRLRESSFRILLHFPTPLPGVESAEMVKKLIIWAQRLVCSPRVRESDAGALTLRLIFQKYVMELGWIVRASFNVVCFERPPYHQVSNGGGAHMVKPTTPVVEYIKSLIDWLDATVEQGEKDLHEACKSSFVHGVLLALRYTFEELDWNSEAVMSSSLEMRSALEKLLDLVMRITSLALGVVSADAWYMPEMDEMGDEDAYLVSEIDVEELSSEQDGIDSKVEHDNRRSEQVVMVGCWLAMKEVSLLLGTVIRKIPLPTNSCSDPLEQLPQYLDVASLETTSNAVLDMERLEQIGSHFLDVLLKMKHNGAIDKTRAGFTALCNRLLCSNDPELCKLTESWMEKLMERTVVKGQTVDDLLRRSAGIPAAFIALFLSEPEGSPKKLLPRALRWLIDLANGSLLRPNDANSPAKSDKVPDSVHQQYETSEKASKNRDEGVVPTVHAFNALRAAFNDANLATDTSGFAAEAIIVSIRSFSSPYWEVRNAACLAYTALVRRMVGFLNVLKRESARRALTGLEFFHRYPLLHPFLLKELKVATDLLEDARPGHSGSNLAKAVHPSLCPMLILLSRLKPSTISSEEGDNLDPFLFMPFIRKCSTQSNLRVRVLAAKALTGLVSNERLPHVLLTIASELPHSEILAKKTTSASFNSIHGMLLQLGCLLDANCRNLADFGTKEKIIHDLVQILVQRSWIGCPKSCPCPILNTSFLQVVDHMLSISDNLLKIRQLLLELSTGCLDAEDSYKMVCYDPTVAELREQATRSYFSCFVRRPKVETEAFLGLQERLTLSLNDSSYEVRLVTLKWLVKFLKHDFLHGEMTKSIQEWTRSSLQKTMTSLLDSEKNRRCVYYILRVIFTWNMLMFEKADDNRDLAGTDYVGQLDFCQVSQFWDKLQSLYKVTRHSKTREKLICCMALCVKQFAALFTSFLLPSSESNQLETPIYLIQSITHFVDLVKCHSSSSEPVNMRMAVAEAITASSLLEQAELIGSSVFNSNPPCNSSSSKGLPNLYASQVLEMWFTSIKLMEDEDDGIRQEVAQNVQKHFHRHQEVSGVPTQVERVIELSFSHLSSTFGHWIPYFTYLLQWVLDTAATPTSVVFTSGSDDLVRRVFDKEIDNHHEEKLLICQICCSHLEKLPLPAIDLCLWRMKFANQLKSFAPDFVGKLGGVEWIGGLGNHKDAFLPVYGNLLGFHAISSCILNGEVQDAMALLSGVVELGRSIERFFSNPLILNLFSLVLKSHEKKAGVSAADQFGCKLVDDDAAALCDGFNPYFLLR